MKKIYCTILFSLILLFAAGPIDYSALWAEDSYEEAQKLADEIHRKAASDVIYTDQEMKALYYQNVQIIELLKEIKELLRQDLEKEE